MSEPAPANGRGSRASSGKRIALASVVASGLLAVAKILIGWIGGSTSVIADGVESAGDVFTSGIVLFGLVIASRPPDEEHPYGHGRFEMLTGLAVGVILGLVGLGISYRSLQNISAVHAPPELYTMWPLFASIAVKSTLSTLKFRIGGRIQSAALVADAWNDMVDILSALVALTALGLTLYDPEHFLAADHFGGFAVGVIVLFTGIRVVRDTSLQLMDTMPDPKRMQELRDAAMRVPGVYGVEKCYARKTGFQYHVDLHLEVNPDMTVRESHELAHLVRIQILASADWVADVLVHVEPWPRRGADDEPSGSSSR